MLQDGYLLAEIGFDTAANEPPKVCCVCAHPELKECESYVTDPPRPGQRDALPTAAGLPGCPGGLLDSALVSSVVDQVLFHEHGPVQDSLATAQALLGNGKFS